MRRLLAVTGLLAATMAACGAPVTPTASPMTTASPAPAASPTPMAVAGGCGLTQVYAGPGPDARLGLWDNPWAPATPASSGVVAYFWYPPPGILSVSDPNVPNSGDAKVLWVFRDPGPGPAGPLTISAHPLGQGSPVVAVGLSNGDKGVPSSVELPTPGCWRLEIAAGTIHATMDVMVAPLAAAPSPSSEAIGVSPTATLAARPSSGPCPVTLAASPGQVPPEVTAFMVGGMSLPSGMTPPPLTMYGNGALWTELGTDSGTLEAAKGSDGLLQVKFPTYRLVEGVVTAIARRLDGPSAGVQVDVPGGYGTTGFQAVGVSFPAPGCWSITEAVAGRGLTFVVRVVAGP